jgi:hypothetical protein
MIEVLVLVDTAFGSIKFLEGVRQLKYYTNAGFIVTAS